ncbi:MAG: hypothetical protein V7603_1701 [Micromonosporaceae bacterium]
MVAVDPRRSRRLHLAAMLVSVALFGSNAASYVFTVLAARVLAPGAFGELSSLLAVLLVGMVPALAAQTAVALRTAGPGGAQPEPVFGGGEHPRRIPWGAQPEPVPG